jgi:hypothetical protein
MPLYMMQWNNKDVSFVLANDREEAAFMLDAEGHARARDLVQVPHFKIRLAFDNTAMHAEPVMHGGDVSFVYHGH